MPTERLCPNCGNLLRAEGRLGPVPAERILGRELLLWLAVTAILAFLWNASTNGERVGGLGAIVLVVWLLRRSRRQAAAASGNTSERYRCDYCQARYEGEGLREINPRQAVD